jgi:hypothetical protein
MALIVGLSLVTLCYFWLSLLRQRFGKKIVFPYTSAVIFFLTMATLQVGISASIWIGMPFLDDPFAAGFQSITIIYWLSFLLLALCEVHIRSKSSLNLVKGLMLLGVVLLNIVTVIEPVGNFGSRYHSEHQAKILYRLGVTDPPVTSQVNTKWAWRDVLRRHSDFLANFNLARIAQEPLEKLMAEAAESECTALLVRNEETANPAIRRLSLVFAQQINPLNTNLYLLRAEGQVGALYPAPPADLWPDSLMEKAVSWKGYYIDETGSGNLEILFESSGKNSRCSLAMPIP